VGGDTAISSSMNARFCLPRRTLSYPRLIASSLFHFTSKLETLLIIIESSRFRASYNVEDISDFYPSAKLAGIPMICFCDIPLKFISEHPMAYGNYGLGFKKEWGLRLGINPILYRAANSPIIETLNEAIKAAKNQIAFLQGKGPSLSSFELTMLNELTLILDKIFKTTTFSKKYESNKILNYYDREWRFVPKDAQIPFLRRHNQRNKLNADYFRKTPEFLPFTLSDIQYIIVPDKKDVKDILSSIQVLPLAEKQRLSLSQRVIDLKSITVDF
jgi:hypothetical protein